MEFHKTGPSYLTLNCFMLVSLLIKKSNQSTCIAPCMVQTTLKRLGMYHTAFNLQKNTMSAFTS